ncbi:MAG TPA: 50S ribosomal protein L11 methyltransferase, partial [Methylobacter sp.]
PGLAFGTGTHPTTALCLEWLASHDLTGKTVIDYGCGSGILAVAAILLGAKEAHAVDIDPQAITATQSNALKNKVQDKIACYLPEQFTPFQADIVLANILAKPLIDMAEQISNLVAPSNHLVLSGILHEQAESVMNAYQQYIIFNAPVQQEDWIRLDGIKR